MESFRYFELALSHWKESGGAIIFEAGNGSKYMPDVWTVDEYGDYCQDLGLTVEESKDATIHALQRGRLSNEEIASLMADWQDAAS